MYLCAFFWLKPYFIDAKQGFPSIVAADIFTNRSEMSV